jgi:hypothetical protein
MNAEEIAIADSTAGYRFGAPQKPPVTQAPETAPDPTPEAAELVRSTIAREPS